MIFRQTRIPYSGREKYPSNQAGNSIASYIKSYLGGGGSSSPATTASTEYNSTENRGTNATSYTVSFDKYNMNMSDSVLTGSYMETFYLSARAGLDTADTLIGDLSTSAISSTYGITGISGYPISVSVSNNGTSGTALQVTFNGDPMTDDGYLLVPVNVNINSNKIDPYHPVWYNNLEKIQTTNLKITWHIDRTSSVSSVYSLSLNNDNASIICNSAGTFVTGTTLPTCKGKLYYGSQFLTGATFACDTSKFTAGVVTSVTQGVLSISFNNNIAFTGDVASVVVSAKVQNTVVDVKTMNITKAKAGATGGVGPQGDTGPQGGTGPQGAGGAQGKNGPQGADGAQGKAGAQGKNGPQGADGAQGNDGTDATIYWLMTNTDSVLYNPNSGTVVPSFISVTAYTQTGLHTPTTLAANTHVTYEYISRRSGVGTGEYAWNGNLNISTSLIVTYNKCRIRLYSDTNRQQLVDMEDVDMLMDGTNGIDGIAGRTGASVRGPYNWYEVSGTSRYFYNGEESVFPDSERWIDIIYKDEIYYYCAESVYYNSVQHDWSYLQNYFESGTPMNFVAANLILSKNAKINFLTGNEIYLMSGNNITAGMAGGSGYSFWAGAEAPSEAPFSVDAQGNLHATNGVFAGYIQYPYQPMSVLPIQNNMYVADTQHPYLVNNTNIPAAVTRCSGYVGTDSNRTYGTQLKLPTPSAELNGFTYRIMIGDYQAGTNYSPVFIPQITQSGGRYITNTLGTRENPTGNAVAAYTGYCLQSGAFVITCLPSPDANGNMNYRWYITDGQVNWIREQMGVPEQVPFIRVIPSTANTTSAAVTGMTEVDCNTDHWDINYDSSTSWISTTKAGPGIWWSIGANTTGSTRRGYVYLRAYDSSNVRVATCTFVINQAG